MTWRSIGLSPSHSHPDQHLCDPGGVFEFDCRIHGIVVHLSGGILWGGGVHSGVDVFEGGFAVFGESGTSDDHQRGAGDIGGIPVLAHSR